jgi:hypothetical protein
MAPFGAQEAPPSAAPEALGDSPEVVETVREPAEAAALARAREAAGGLARELLARLGAELAEGGVVQATRVCSEVAPALAAAHSTDGLTVRRVSVRPRNPNGRPDEWETAGLARLAELHAAGELPDEVGAVVDGEKGPALRFLKPLRIAATCLRCHGDPAGFPPELAAALAERYPADKAVGYRAGDLRGAISVTVPLAAAATETR